MDLISIIVPVYNVEPYLDRCVQSIVNQTYQNIEIILVDDGSPDRCGLMCDDWASRDSRIRVIHKPNGGLSDARNAGLSAAAGQFISFVDSDDWVHPSFVELLHQHLTANQADLAECAYQITTKYGIDSVSEPSASMCDTAQALHFHILDQRFNQVVWNKLFRRDTIQDLFPINKQHEDEFWTYRVLANCRKLIHIDVPLYYYFQRSGSIMGASYSRKNLDVIEARCGRLAFLRHGFPTLADEGEANLFFSCLYHGQKALQTFTGNELHEVLSFLADTIRNNPISNPQRLTKPHQLWYCLASQNFSMACRLRNLLKIGL